MYLFHFVLTIILLSLITLPQPAMSEERSSDEWRD